jgi:hypothetical protein
VVIYSFVMIGLRHYIHAVFAKGEEVTLSQAYLNHDMRIYLVGCWGTAIEAWLWSRDVGAMDAG